MCLAYGLSVDMRRQALQSTMDINENQIDMCVCGGWTIMTTLQLKMAIIDRIERDFRNFMRTGLVWLNVFGEV